MAKFTSEKYYNKRIGYRCIIKFMEIQEYPFFPAPPPYELKGYDPENKKLLLAGPWTDEILIRVDPKHVEIFPKKTNMEEYYYAKMSTMYIPVKKD